nr:hypothetical protein BaRGS_002564 [Batillaria attramentaria]
MNWHNSFIDKALLTFSTLPILTAQDRRVPYTAGQFQDLYGRQHSCLYGQEQNPEIRGHRVRQFSVRKTYENNINNNDSSITIIHAITDNQTTFSSCHYNSVRAGSRGVEGGGALTNYNAIRQTNYNAIRQANYNAIRQANYNAIRQANYNAIRQANYNAIRQANYNAIRQANYNAIRQANYNAIRQANYNAIRQANYNNASKR